MSTYEDLAELIFPDVKETVEDLEKRYPPRNLPEGAMVTRFAPSPTGFLHTGSLFTALVAYTVAKQSKGVYFFRLEDTDQKREIAGSGSELVDQLAYFGVIQDEGYFGNEEKGSYGPYVQSKRADIYKIVIKELMKRGRAYPCFCTPEDLNLLRQTQEANKITPGYYGPYAKCRNYSIDEAIEMIKAGKPYVIRFNMPTEGTTTFHDVIYGDITVNNEEMEDLILIKSDGYPTYNFANVVDDHLMGITHVVRGNEYLSSSPKYNRIYEAFGWEIPTYVHCPLITDETHAKLSKRSGHSSYEDLLDQGFVSEAIVNYVALLGWSPADNNEIFSLQELVEKFDYHHINKSPAVFDINKLRWMNGEYIKKMDPDVFYEKALPYMKQVLTKDFNFKKIAGMVQTRIETFPDIPALIDFFEAVPEYDASMYCHKKMKTNEETSLTVLKEALPVLEAQEDYTNDPLFASLSEFVKEKGYKNGYVMWPLRTAVSGKQMTPAGATEIMEIIGKEETLRRVNAAIEKLENL